MPAELFQSMNPGYINSPNEDYECHTELPVDRIIEQRMEIHAHTPYMPNCLHMRYQCQINSYETTNINRRTANITQWDGIQHHGASAREWITQIDGLFD